MNNNDEVNKKRKEYEKALWGSEFEISLVEFNLAGGMSAVDNMPGLGLGVRSSDGVILRASSEWKRYGFDPKEMKGKLFMDFLAPEDVEATLKVFESATKESDVHQDYGFSNHYVNKKGEKVKLAWLSRLIDNDKFIVANARIVKG